MGCLNENLNLDETNFFEFLDCKLAFATGEYSVYLTPQGEFILKGEPYGKNWQEYVYKFGLDSSYGISKIDLNDIPLGIQKRIKKAYDKEKLLWMNYAEINEKQVQVLQLLHQQYLAIADYSKNPNNKDTIDIIKSTYELTGINCLRYLSGLKTVDEWLNLKHTSQGLQIGTMFTGYVESSLFDNNTKKHLIDMHNQLNHYINEIDRISLENSNDNDIHIKTKR